MSVQLIVYPQSFEGQYNEISSSPTEFIVNGINFANLDSTPAYTSSSSPPYVDTLTNEPATIPNTWYRFRNTAGGTPDLPTNLSGSLILKSVVGSGSFTGVYQRLTNLVIGQQYTITINLSVSTTGFIITQIANGTIIYSGGGGNANVTQITDTFTAQSTDSTVMIAYLNTIVGTATITDLSIQPVVGEIPSGATNFLDNGQVIVDLYEDEDIPLTLSVDDFKNIAEKVQSYSKAFNLPATKRNNKIFDQIFEITRSYDGVIFNPYRRTQCVLKQDGFILFEGYLKMLDVTDKEGEISYNVNLYSEVIALADILQDRTFRDLDFTELTHSYDKDNIKKSWNDSGNSIAYTNPSTSGFRDDYTTLRYPFVDWNHQFILASNTGASGPNNGNTELANLETAFRPFINIKYIIDRIFEATDFTYESAFFNTTDFEKLYMDFNWGGEEPETGVGNLSVGDPLVYSTGNYQPLLLYSNDFPSNAGYNSSNGVFTAQFDNQSYVINAEFQVSNLNNSADLKWRWLHKDASGNIIDDFDLTPWLGGGGPFVIPWNISLNKILNQNETLEFQYRSTLNNSFQSLSSVTVGTAFVLATNNTILQTLRGETGQWEFLKGLLTMFNLVTLPDESNPDNILIEPYSDVFTPTATGGTTLANRGIEHDWTEKIDVSQMKLTPLTDLNRKTIFKFVEDEDDYSFMQYKNALGGFLYGSKLYNAGNEFNILDGEEEIIAEPFAATVVKPIMDNFPDFITPAIYAMNDDANSEGFENSPRIMYNNGIKNTGSTYFIPAQNGLSSENQDSFLQFSHLSSIPSTSATLDFHFGECQLFTGVGNSTAQNLFNLYWLPYLSELYNPDTRIMTIKVNLSPADINTFRFNDTVFIKNRVFRVNKIDYKPNDLATVEFILIP
tara:strand:- start:1520 stop:4216 length:2697 start_codon:yes stop_codon:yes gene_type:complete